MKRSDGFSLLEILTVMVVIAIAASAAAPSYRDKIVRARISSNLLPVLYGYKDKLENFLLFSPSNGACFIDKLNTFDKNLDLSKTVNGVGGEYKDNENIIQVSANMQSPSGRGVGVKQIGNKPLILELRVKKVNGFITWSCHSEKVYSDFAPHVCQQSYELKTTTSPNVTMGSCPEVIFDTDIGRLHENINRDCQVWVYIRGYPFCKAVLFAMGFIIDASGQILDTFGNVVGYTTDALGNSITTTLDTAGKVTTTILDMNGTVTVTVLDAIGSATYTTTITDPAGEVTVIVFNTAGETITTVTDAAGNAVTTTLDAAGNTITSTTDALGNALGSAGGAAASFFSGL